MKGIATAWIVDQLSDEAALARRAWKLFTLDAWGLVLAASSIVVIGLMAGSIASIPLVATGLIHSELATVAVLALAFSATVGPLLGGLYGMFPVMIRQGSRVRARAVFGGYRRWRSMFLASLPLVIATTLMDAYLWSVWLPLRLICVVGFALGVGFIYVLPAIVDADVDFRLALGIAMRLLRSRERSRTIVAAAFLWLATALWIGLPRTVITTGPDTAIAFLASFVAVPLIASYVTCMYFRAGNQSRIIDTTIAAGLPAHGPRESPSHRRSLRRWVVGVLCAVGIVIIALIIQTAFSRP